MEASSRLEKLPLDNMPLQFATVRLNCRALKPILFDKFPGFIIRSGFGAALKSLCRYYDKHSCGGCQFVNACPYAYIFETPRLQNDNTDFTAENFPHPFVFAPPQLEHDFIRTNQAFSFNLTLFGRGISYLMFYIYAFDLLGELGLGKERGTFELESVVDHVTGSKIYKSDNKRITADPTNLNLAVFNSSKTVNTVRIHLQSPLKLLNRGRSATTITPDLFIRSLLRRASLIAQTHQDASWQIDFREIIDQFVNCVDISDPRLRTVQLHRYSARQRRAQPIYALTGSFQLHGSLAAFMPLLCLGEVMHLGKNTSMGLGKYEIN